VPISDWFRNELKEELITTLSEENISKHNYFNYNHINSLIDKHIYQGIDQSVKLWTLFCFQKWYNHNFN
jgi:asparagine synthase (glutamine-hydrolysing)